MLPKAAGLIVLVRLVLDAMPGSEPYGWRIAFGLAVASMTVGNALALWQDNLRRLLAYSSIANAGYMLIGLAVGLASTHAAVRWDGIAAMFFYLCVYAAATLGVFAMLIYLGRDERQVEAVDDLAGLGRTRPLAAAGMAVFLFSLTGLPPLAGLWGKFFLFASALAVPSEAGPGLRPWFVGLAIFAVLNAAVAAYYYLRIVAVMYFRDPLAAPKPQGGAAPAAAAWLCAAVVLGLFAFPSSLMRSVPQGPSPISQQVASETRALPEKPPPQTVEGLWTYKGEFHAAIARADRIVVRYRLYNELERVGGQKVIFSVTNPTELKNIASHIKFQSPQKIDSIFCGGDPEIDWYAGGKRVAVTWLIPDRFLRWSGFPGWKGEPGDAELTAESATWIATWLPKRRGPWTEEELAAARLKASADREAAGRQQSAAREARVILGENLPAGYLAAAKRAAAVPCDTDSATEDEARDAIARYDEAMGKCIRAAFQDDKSMYVALFRILGCLPMSWGSLYAPSKRKRATSLSALLAPILTGRFNPPRNRRTPRRDRARPVSSFRDSTCRWTGRRRPTFPDG